MNLANKLTLFRVLLVPVFVVLLLIEAIPNNYLWALLVFVVACATDFLDGYIARKYNMITAFGKFLDPIADKVLVVSALVSFIQLGWVQSWVVVVILAREFIVSGIRLAAVESTEKIVIPARFSGKLKTAATMIAICAILTMWMLADFRVIQYEVRYLIPGIRPEIVTQPISNILMYICAGLTVISGIQYVWDARKVLK